MRKSKFVTFLLIVSGTISVLTDCVNKTSKNSIEIKGNIKGLPDGKMVIQKVYSWENIDSTLSKNGSFLLSIPSKGFPEPILVRLIHFDSSGIKRIFSFKTNNKFNGGFNFDTSFMLEDGIEIIDTLVNEFNNLNNGIKIVSVDKFVKMGKQTDVMYNDSVNFRSIAQISKIKQLVEQSPFSYFYLYELKNRMSNFSNEQFLDIFKLFDEDVRESETGKGLRKYVENRSSKRIDFETTIESDSGQKEAILVKSAKLNMVILWASWCGPCRQEIPHLKKLYQQFSKDKSINFVSVSVDNEKEDWFRALGHEKMQWRQLLLIGKEKIYYKELFNFDGSIPTILFINNQGKIVKKTVGFDEKNMEVFKDLLLKYSSSPS